MAGKTLAEATEFYFVEVMGAVRSGLFDTLGHLDQCKRWLLPWFRVAAWAAAPELYEPILVALAASGTALEVNASGLRHATGETYPAAWAVARFRELGGQRVTTGSTRILPESFAFGSSGRTRSSPPPGSIGWLWNGRSIGGIWCCRIGFAAQVDRSNLTRADTALLHRPVTLGDGADRHWSGAAYTDRRGAAAASYLLLAEAQRCSWTWARARSPTWRRPWSRAP